MVVTGAGSGHHGGRACEGAGRERSLGVNIRLPHEQGANEFIAQDPKLVEMRYFFTRKLMLIKESDGYAVLPGGFGTLDEAFELLTLLQTGKAQPAPLVLLDVPGGTYWEGWQEFLDREVGRRGLVSPEDRAALRRSPPTSTRPPPSCSASTATTTRAAGWAISSSCACRWPPPGPSWPSSTSASPTSWPHGSIRPTKPLGPERSERRPPGAAPAWRCASTGIHYGRLRQLIDALNALVPTDADGQLAPRAPAEDACRSKTPSAEARRRPRPRSTPGPCAA